MLVDLHNRCLVTASITVIGSYITAQCQKKSFRSRQSSLTREYGNHVTVLRPIITLHYQLMCPRHQSEAVIMIECFRNILPKRVSGSSGRYSPATTVIWVGPKQITHRSFVGHFLDAVQRADVVEGVDTG